MKKIAIYGKGGIGKSSIAANITAALIRMPTSFSVSFTALETADGVIYRFFAACDMEWQLAISIIYFRF